MSGFDPERAVRQMMVDTLVQAINARTDQNGYGWHITNLDSGGITEDGVKVTRITFETGYPLRGWDVRNPDQYVDGPHTVIVTVQGG